MSDNFRPKNTIMRDGFLYRLDRWSYLNDYDTIEAFYYPDDDMANIDQSIRIVISNDDY
ncbi:hypothetical protein [Alishewanella phage vB_AspM_Slicko01]|nr:hypothetical protein [Alishewanella phage vB_AspM_Slicko01]